MSKPLGNHKQNTIMDFLESNDGAQYQRSPFISKLYLRRRQCGFVTADAWVEGKGEFHIGNNPKHTVLRTATAADKVLNHQSQSRKAATMSWIEISNVCGSRPEATAAE